MAKIVGRADASPSFDERRADDPDAARDLGVGVVGYSEAGTLRGVCVRLGPADELAWCDAGWAVCCVDWDWDPLD
jgi:hypothetical protein